mgnify:CR=1 FL=1
MTAVSGLPSPNPYAQPTARAVSRARPAESGASLLNQPISHHPSYSPDWMQAEHASSATPAIYSVKGELQKLPAAESPANEAAKSNNAVTDNVTLSSRSGVR